jgi:hypothetical protein
MLAIIWANSFNQSKWSSKIFSEDKTEGAMTVLVLVGEGKTPPHTENGVSRGWCSSTASLELCAMVPPKNYFGGISNFNISPTRIASPSKHQCN